jgi:signal transduction histidine kinase
MKQFIELFKNRPFEVKISLLVCLLGMLRIGVAVVEDWSRNIVVAELLTDSVLLIIFSSLFYVAFTRPGFKGIHPAFGIVMIIFFSFNFIEFAGVAGNSEFNVLSAILGIACLFSGRWMYALTFLIVALTVALQIIILYNTDFMQSFFLYSSDQYSDFVFSIICVVAITILLKQLASSEQNKLESKIKELNSSVALAKTTNRILLQKHQELERAKAALEIEVEKRTHHLNQQNAAIEKYIYYNTEELKNPLTNLLEAVNSYQGDSPLYPFLQISSSELKSVMNTINEALTSDQKLDRSKLR